MPACYQFKRLKQNNLAPARELASWKAKIRQHWHGISIERIDDAETNIQEGEALTIRVKVHLNGLNTDDVSIECLVDKPHEYEEHNFKNPDCFLFKYESKQDGEHIFSLALQPDDSGVNLYKIRMFPCHALLSHPLETGFISWL